MAELSVSMYGGAKAQALAITREIQARDEALRELLSYCRTRSAEVSGPGQGDDYGDVADRLAKILDGES